MRGEKQTWLLCLKLFNQKPNASDDCDIRYLLTEFNQDEAITTLKYQY